MLYIKAQVLVPKYKVYTRNLNVILGLRVVIEEEECSRNMQTLIVKIFSSVKWKRMEVHVHVMHHVDLVFWTARCCTLKS